MRLTATMAVATCMLLVAAGPAKGQKDPQTTFEPRSSPGLARVSSKSSRATGASPRPSTRRLRAPFGLRDDAIRP